MGAAGAIELAGNIPSLQDGIAHATINVDNLDPSCTLSGLVTEKAVQSLEVLMSSSIILLECLESIPFLS